MHRFRAKSASRRLPVIPARRRRAPTTLRRVVITDLLAPTHLLLILVVALLVLGPKRLPEAGRSLGRGLRELRDGLSGHEPEDHPSRRCSD